MIITCLGFKFDSSIFNKSVKFHSAGTNRLKKYPRMTYQYESTDIPGLFFAGEVLTNAMYAWHQLDFYVHCTGTNTHSLDYRRSAGGFIHGFRYSARSLHRILENRYHNVPWPYVKFQSAIQVIPHMLKRLNEASDIYQMFSVLCEIMIFSEDATEATYLEVWPVCHKSPYVILRRNFMHFRHIHVLL